MPINIEQYVDIETLAGPSGIAPPTPTPPFIPGDLMLLDGTVFKLLNGSDFLLLGA